MRLRIKNKPVDPLIYMLIIYLATISIILMSGCNPVKQVISDKRKLDQVAEVVVRSGYCANDTTIVTVSDTITKVDTITNTDTEIVLRNDTVIMTRIKRDYVTKTIRIRDTIRQVVVDHARIRLLEADKIKIVAELEEKKKESQSRMKWLVILGLIIAAYLYFKK